MVKISTTGYWIGTELPHGVDTGLATALVEFFKRYDYPYKFDAGIVNGKICRVIDVGCGNGFYTKTLLHSGIYCDGYDGNPNTPEITNNICQVFDFTQRVDYLNFPNEYDWALSLEVGEHISPVYEQIFLDNLAALATEGIVLSWATEGQGGDGHVNCKNNDYIISEMEKRNFIFDMELTEPLRNACAAYPNTGWWFRNTIMVFRKYK